MGFTRCKAVLQIDKPKQKITVLPAGISIHPATTQESLALQKVMSLFLRASRSTACASIHQIRG